MIDLKLLRAGFILCPLVFLAMTDFSFAATLTVGKGRAFQTISKALEQAEPGDRVEVYGGNYKENILIDKPVDLVGRELPVIDGGGEGHVVVIKAPKVLFQGFKVIRSGGNLANDDSCIYVEGTSVQTIISKNKVEDCAFGIWINGAHKAEVVENHVVGRRELISQKRGNGIHMWNVQKGLVEGNKVEGARDGILFSVTRNTLIKNNTIWDLRYGIHYMYADFNRLEGNVVYNTRAGLAIMFSKKLEIENNYSYDNSEYGILFRDIFRSKVINNVMVNNDKGLFLYNSLYNKISGNIVADNNIGSHVWAGSEKNLVSDNSFINNQSQIKYVGLVDEEWSTEGRGNYWSDYLGWDTEGDGIGDKPYEPNTVMERLIWAYPMVKLLINSPAIQTLRVAENQFPVIRQPGIVDSAPLMRPVNEEWRKWVGRNRN